MQTREDLETSIEHYRRQYYQEKGESYRFHNKIDELEGTRRKIADLCIIIITSTIVFSAFVHIVDTIIEAFII